jgi:nucleotide-binding universal stress UspA family protein
VPAARSEPADSSILVIVDDASSAEPLLGWALHRADRRDSRINVWYLPAFPGAGEGRILDPGMAEQGQKELTACLDHLGAGSRASVHLADAGESNTEVIRAMALKDPDGLVMVGPLDPSSLVSLIFGSGSQGASGREVPVVVVPRSAWPTPRSRATPPRVTVGFHGSNPAVDALAWAVGEANRTDGVVRAVMAWYEGDYGGLGGPVAIPAPPSSLVGPSADRLAADSLSRCGVPTDRVSAIARRGMPSSVLTREATGSDLLAVGAGQSAVYGHRTLGAVTSACLTRSPVPVVIVPSALGQFGPTRGALR